MMTDNDRRLVRLAQDADCRDDYRYIDSLIPRAETEDCREVLRDYSSHSFSNAERAHFERDYDD